MKFNDLIKTSISSLSVNKGRSVLTMLGIIIGIASIIIILSVGDGAQGLILSEVNSFGANNVFILPGKQPKGLMGIGGTLMNDSLKVRDYLALKNKSNVPDAINVIPYVFRPTSVSYQSNTYSSTIIGSTPQIKNVFSIKMKSGYFFNNSDIQSNSRVAVIGNDVKNNLFGMQDAIGNKIKIEGVVFRVIGVINKKGSGSSPINIDKSILAPYPPVQKDVLGIKYFQRIAIEASSPTTINNVKHEAEATLRMEHNITNPNNDDFFTQTQQDIANRVETIMNILTILISSVAAISLIVGGVGIMNAMFVSVTERTREIGLRKALGASYGDILKQFLTESIFLTFGGGIIGIIFGAVFTFLVIWATKLFANIVFPFTISIIGILLGAGVSVIIGLIFGIFPARTAAKKTPIEAIIYK